MLFDIDPNFHPFKANVRRVWAERFVLLLLAMASLCAFFHALHKVMHLVKG